MPNQPPTTCFVHPLLRARDWQDRPEFAQLCDWWRKGGVGVCALVGIGGAGKTAISEHFLRVLPRGLPALEGTAKDNTLPAPRSVFVFSFYDAPNPDHFFGQLHAWLNDAPFDESVKTPSYQQTLQFLGKVAQVSSPASSSPQSPILLLLDGLEKVQDDGARGGIFGQLLDGPLRDLILRAADGWLPGVALLVTTRFRLFDPLAQRSALYRQIDIDQLQSPAAIALLRARGVHTTEVRLLALAKDSGFHALTLDLLGGYVGAFCDGTPSCLPPLAEVKVPDEVAAGDPRLAAVKEQERKFVRLAQRYREALAKHDPAALALMERVCLFRLGVNVDTLAAIFTGAGKEAVSGPALAALGREQVGKKLRLLAQMRLLDESKFHSTLSFKNPHPSANYIVHPAIRDGFLHSLDAHAAKCGHDDARRVLENELEEENTSFLVDEKDDLLVTEKEERIALSNLPGVEYSFTLAKLDLLEEIVHHTLEADRWQDAWDIYWNRIGSYENLGWKLGAYSRGERLSRMFIDAGLQQGRSGLSDVQRGLMCNQLGLYLRHLGQLEEARESIERHRAIQIRESRWSFVSVGCQNLAEIRSLQGLLIKAEELSTEAVYFAERIGDREQEKTSLAQRGNARGLRGNLLLALQDYKRCLALHRGVFGGKGDFIWGSWGIFHTVLLTRLGQFNEAKAQTLANRLSCQGEHLRVGAILPKCDLVLANLACEQDNLPEAATLQGRAHEWAIVRDAKELLCWSALIRGRIRISEAARQNSGTSNEQSLAEACQCLCEGLRIARDCGYGIYHIDLLLESARLNLLRGEPQPAMDYLRIALDDGVHPPLDSGFPTLLAANDSECGYAWGIAEGRHLRTQAFLLRAAQILDRPDFAPANFQALPAEVRSLIESARRELELCRDLRQRIQDPKVRDTEKVLKDLEGGVLTSYPLKPITEDLAPKAIITQEEGKKDMPTNQQFDVFLSHNSKDKPTVRELKRLLAAKGLAVWLDEDELRPGIPWQQLLEAAIKNSQSVAVLVGRDGLGPWEDEEMQAALIHAVKDKRPVIPVLLPSASAQPELPMFLLNRTWVDLRAGFSDLALSKLKWGITGTKPSLHSQQPTENVPVEKCESVDPPKAEAFDEPQVEPNEEMVNRASLIKKLAELTHGDIDSLVATLGATNIPDKLSNRKSRSAKLVEWAQRPDGKGIAEVIDAARQLDLQGFQKAIPDPS